MGRIGLRAASVLLTFLWVATGPAQDRFPNMAATSQLPHGAGLAQAFPGDRGIEQAAEVIFAEDFESDDWRRKWAEIRDPDQAVLSRVDESATDARLGHHSLRVQATLGNNTGGGVTTWFESADTIYVRFYVKFAADCDYVHHFCTLRANRGLSGGDRWSGFGGAGLRPQGDERFSTALEPWGNWSRWPPPGRWNMYTYWHEMQVSPDGILDRCPDSNAAALNTTSGVVCHALPTPPSCQSAANCSLGSGYLPRTGPGAVCRAGRGAACRATALRVPGQSGGDRRPAASTELDH